MPCLSRSHQARARDGQAEQVDHDRQVLSPGGARLRPARVAVDDPRYAHRRPVRQERAHLPRRPRDRRARADRHAVRRPRPHRREHLQGPDDVQRPPHLGCLRARSGRPRGGHGPARRRARRRPRLRLPPRRPRCGRLPQAAGQAPGERRDAADSRQRDRARHRDRGRRARHPEDATPGRDRGRRLRGAAHRPGQYRGATTGSRR